MHWGKRRKKTKYTHRGETRTVGRKGGGGVLKPDFSREKERGGTENLIKKKSC